MRRFPVILNVRLNCSAEKMCEWLPYYPRHRYLPLSTHACAGGTKNWTARGRELSAAAVKIVK
jgi:hypothetical protein